MGREYPYDVRVLANVRDNAYWVNTLLHEFGHTVYDKYVNPALPYFLRSIAHINSTEAIAQAIFGPGARDDWKTTVLRATGEELMDFPR